MERSNKRARLMFETTNLNTVNRSEVQEKEIMIYSKNRTSGSIYNAQFLLPVPLRGIQELSLSSLSYYNTFQNMKGADNHIEFISGPTNFSAYFAQGFWTSGLGTTTLAEVVADPTNYLNDVRWQILRASIGSLLINSVTLNPVNNNLEIEFIQAVDPADDEITMTNFTDSQLYTNAVQTITGRDLGNVYSSNLIKLKSTSTLQICSQHLDTKFSGTTPITSGASCFALVPIDSGFGYKGLYTPSQNSTVIRYPTPINVTSVLQIAMRDQDGVLAEDMSEDWILVLRLKSNSA